MAAKKHTNDIFANKKKQDDFSEWVKKIRLEKSLTQTQAATAAGWKGNSAKTAWAHYEAGNRARPETVAKIAKGLGVDTEEALRRAGYLPSNKIDPIETRLTITYTGPDRLGISLAITRVLSDTGVNVTRMCMEGAEGVSLAFVQISGTLETANVLQACIDIDNSIRTAIRYIMDRCDKTCGPQFGSPWHLSVIHNPIDKAAVKYSQIFNFHVKTLNKSGELYKVVEFLTEDAKLNIMSLFSVLTPEPLTYTENIGQCGRIAGPKENLEAYKESLCEKLSKKLGIPNDADNISFTLEAHNLPDANRRNQFNEAGGRVALKSADIEEVLDRSTC